MLQFTNSKKRIPIDNIIANNAVNATYLRMLIDKIEISERSERGLDIAVVVKANFRDHFNIHKMVMLKKVILLNHQTNPMQYRINPPKFS